MYSSLFAAPTSAQFTEMFDKKTDTPDSAVGNGEERRDSESGVGQKVIHQAELESQLFKVRGKKTFERKP